MGLFSANIKMLLRDREALFWALAFPLVFVVVFGLFDVGKTSPYRMAIVDLAESPLSRSIKSELSQFDMLRINNEFSSESDSRQAVEDGLVEFALVIPSELSRIDDSTATNTPVRMTLYFDQNGPQPNQLVFGAVNQALGHENLESPNTPHLINLNPQTVKSPPITYFDVVLIGLVGMGVMFNSILVIGVKLTSYRQQNILRRILVTPLKVRNYFASVILTHMLLSLVQTVIILATGILIFDAHIVGNIVWLFPIIILANFVFLNIGFSIGGWSRSPAAASGLGNIIVMPMMFFSGTFFPTSNLPSFLPDLVKILPLTPTLDALRSVGIDGNPLWQTWPELAMLAGWGIVSAGFAIKVFRFDQPD
ncbi:ABC transporter permease [SAR202 cluster bacterium AD-804-J14_MRT_500m]|nr:ABC transporter permease [SAR202 cluster bacterium AD-804-J14_MRT_500m]